jgi:hypothetical protein
MTLKPGQQANGKRSFKFTKASQAQPSTALYNPARPSFSFRSLFGRLLRLHGPRYPFAFFSGVLGPLGSLFAALGALLAALGRSWAALRCSWEALGRLLGASWALLGSSWPLLGRSWNDMQKSSKNRCPK